MLVGEAFVGDIPNNAHPNVLLGRREIMFPVVAQAIAQPSKGFVPFMTVLRPNVMVKPDTLFVCKVELDTPELARMSWGPAQAGVARGVHEALREGILPPEAKADWMIIAAVWVNPKAHDAAMMEDNNRLAMKLAIGNAIAGISREALDAAAASVSNPFHG